MCLLKARARLDFEIALTLPSFPSSILQHRYHVPLSFLSVCVAKFAPLLRLFLLLAISPSSPVCFWPLSPFRSFGVAPSGMKRRRREEKIPGRRRGREKERNCKLKRRKGWKKDRPSVPSCSKASSSSTAAKFPFSSSVCFLLVEPAWPV